MKKEYVFSKMKEVKNPYHGTQKHKGIKIQPVVLKYFKKMSKNVGLSYEQLIELYLLDCVKNKKIFKKYKPKIQKCNKP